MSTFQELLESAFGDHFISVVIAALVAYFVAGVIVFQWPSPSPRAWVAAPRG